MPFYVYLKMFQMGLLLWSFFSDQKDESLRKSISWAIFRLTDLNINVFHHMVEVVGIGVVIEKMQSFASSNRERLAFVNCMLRLYSPEAGSHRFAF